MVSQTCARRLSRSMCLSRTDPVWVNCLVHSTLDLAKSDLSVDSFPIVPIQVSRSFVGRCASLLDHRFDQLSNLLDRTTRKLEPLLQSSARLNQLLLAVQKLTLHLLLCLLERAGLGGVVAARLSVQSFGLPPKTFIGVRCGRIPGRSIAGVAIRIGLTKEKGQIDRQTRHRCPS